MGSSFLSRVMVFIDGEYFEKEIRERKITDKGDEGISYHNLAYVLKDQLQRESIKPQLTRAYYYNALPNMDDLQHIKDPKEREKIKTKIESLLNKLKPKFDRIAALDMFDVRLGRLVYTRDGDFRQKGVDSLIAIDMLTKAFQEHCDEALLVAGDADFVEVVKSVKETKVSVAGAYFKSNINKDLLLSFDKKIELDNLDLVKNGILD